MNDLEETAIAFIRAIRATGKECLGHERFSFKMNIEMMAPKEDRELATVLGVKLQEALTNASSAAQPANIEGMSQK